MTARWSTLILALLIGTLACDGGQSGGELGLDDNPEGTGGAGGVGGGTAIDHGAMCDETPTALALDEESPLGFSANDVLELAEGTHEAAMVYTPDEQSLAMVEVTPDSESTTITVTIEAAGTAAFVDSEPPQQTGAGPTIDLAFSCEDFMAVDVTVTVTTADGAFDETLDGRLVARSDSQVSLSLPLDLEALNGSFEVTVLEPEGGEPVQTSLSALLSEGVFAGEISGMVQHIGPDVAQAGGVTYGNWGYGDCETGRVPVTENDGTEALTTEALLDVVNESSPLTLTWSDGTSTELAVAASSPGSLCLELEDPMLGLEGGRYFASAQATLTTSDGRLDTTQPITIEAYYDGGSLDALSMSFASISFTEPSDFESTYGLSGVDLGDHTDISLLLGLDYTVTGETATATGDLRVVGIPPTDCVDTPNSACGSPGQQPIEIAPISSP